MDEVLDYKFGCDLDCVVYVYYQDGRRLPLDSPSKAVCASSSSVARRSGSKSLFTFQHTSVARDDRPTKNRSTAPSCADRAKHVVRRVCQRQDARDNVRSNDLSSRIAVHAGLWAVNGTGYGEGLCPRHPTLGPGACSMRSGVCQDDHLMNLSPRVLQVKIIMLVRHSHALFNAYKRVLAQ